MDPSHWQFFAATNNSQRPAFTIRNHVTVEFSSQSQRIGLS